MKNIIIVFLTFLFSQHLFAQSVGIGISTPNASAALDITAANKGLLIPRIALTSNTDVTTVPTPASSLLIYNTATAGSGRFMVTPGFYYWNNLSLSWTAFVPGDNSVKGAWLLGGNIATSLATNFLGTTDNQSLLFKINNTNAGYLGTAGNSFWGLNSGNINSSGNNNTAMGTGSLLNNITGYSNVAVGINALRLSNGTSNLVAIGDSALFNNGVGAINDQAFYNTAVGSKALFANTTGLANSAVGSQALYSNTTGVLNNAFGYQALVSNTTGNLNSAIGYLALGGNSIGNNNIAHGYVALSNNKTGNGNVGIGSQVLGNSVNGSNIVAIGDSVLANYNNNVTTLTSFFGNNTAIGSKVMYTATTGTSNTAVGSQAMYENTIGNFNVAVGNVSLHDNSTGNSNTAIGMQSMAKIVGGNNNTAVGRASLYNITSGDNNTAIGGSALSSASLVNKNTAIGYSADAPNSFSTNATAIGANAIANCSNCMVLGSVPGLNGGTANINVGIGTNMPSTDLHINPNGAGSILVGTNKNSGGYTNLEMGINTQSGGYSFLQSTKASGSAWGNLILNQSGGNVGIGVTAPQTYLHVNPNGAGSILLGTNRTTGGYTNLEMGISSQSGGYSYIQSTKASGTSQGTLQLNPSGGFVTTGSYVGIGTNTPFFPLDVVQSNNPDETAIRILSPSHNWGMGVAAISHDLIFTHNYNYRASISSIDGSYTSYSDRRMKKNIEDLSPVLDKVLLLKAKKYQCIDAGETTKKSTGFISQEVIDLFPELVSSFKRTAEDPTLYLGLNYAGFSVIAIKAIQEQQIIIKSQNKRIEKLEQQMELLLSK